MYGWVDGWMHKPKDAVDRSIDCLVRLIILITLIILIRPIDR